MRRNTGPSSATIRLLHDRAAGRCELCGTVLAGAMFSRHHRRPRGMGGTSVPWINDVTNLLLLCGSATTGCHDRVERYRATAYSVGVLLRMGEHPEQVPVHIYGQGVVYLTPDGRYAEGAP